MNEEPWEGERTWASRQSASHKSAVRENSGRQAGTKFRWSGKSAHRIVELAHTYPDGGKVTNLWYNRSLHVVQGGGFIQEITNTRGGSRLHGVEDPISVWDDVYQQMEQALLDGAEYFEMVQHMEQRGEMGEVRLDAGANPIRERPFVYRIKLGDFLYAQPPASVWYKPDSALGTSRRYGVGLEYFQKLDHTGKVVEEAKPLTVQASLF